jgi:8-oxo-dGTP pyrophosphatase MutT (NUDIX family)
VTLHDDARRLLAGWRAPDARQETLRQEYVAHLDAHADGLLRTCLPDHVTASTVVLSPDGEQVLLTLHAKAGAWFQLGGHTEAGDATLAGAALREALEESGLDDLELDPEPVQLDLHEVPFCGARPGTRHLDVRFLAVAAPGTEHAVSEESVDVRWWPAGRLPSDERSLRELVDLGRDRLRDRVRLGQV